MVFGGPTTRATRPGDENAHLGATGSGGRDACRCRRRRAGASAETMETRDHRAQGRCRLPADGGREDAIRYLSAQSKALRYALSHRDETIALATEATDAKPEDPRPAFVFDDAVKVGAIAPELPLPMDKLAWMQGQMVELGQIPKAGDLAKMVNTDIRAQAVERAGK
jgi:hypothetical protein